ncbi:unnamed protein product [Lasius platythorax]|uniref:Uncharacterized protein n=1 Tax=Lasius platythorax TaxID=488582 RepID=A0AAV2NE70_9HYME
MLAYLIAVREKKIEPGRGSKEADKDEDTAGDIKGDLAGTELHSFRVCMLHAPVYLMLLPHAITASLIVVRLLRRIVK